MRLLIAFVLILSLSQTALSIVPQPKTITLGPGVTNIRKDFKFETSSSSSILRDNIARYTDLIFSNKLDNGDDGIESIQLIVESDDETLNLETDESYVITIDDNGSFIQGKTIYGVKHGLETLSQVIKFNRSTKRFEIPNFVKIMDAPRFKWRGLLLDTSRHYIKKENILSTLRGMEAVKMNVLHWHIIDAESFPLELESHPLLSEKGAYDQDAVYNATTIQEVIEAAKKSGIRVVFELDVPGHAASWGKGYPNITVECSKYSRNINNIPLDPTESFTYDVLDKVFTEISEMSDDEYIHTGGDEVVFGCFTNNTKILKYMADNGIKDAKKLAHLFEGKLDAIFERLGRKKIIWQDMYGYGAHVDPRNTIVHFWNDKSVLREVLSKNIRSIISTGFYLNNLLKWEDYYGYEPIPSGLNPRERDLIIGGEACVWAEKISSEVLDSVVWPRAAAVAERLWSNESVRDTNNMATRIKEGLTCHLGRRGVHSVPLAPGHCY